ncbi:MAG: 16S rRNA (cytidine(1402)-2'-O)-methyltransferase [Pseudobdellovibrionaceae bacterium]
MPDPISYFTESKKLVLQSGLYLVATPIGNMRDMTLRAIDTLMAADIVACEDTRVSGKLFHLMGLSKKLVPYHDHNADQMRPEIMARIREGQSIALISDAGMPLISDPGYKLVRDCLAAGLYVTSLPGANAPLTALQLSGLPSDQFAFLGFLPSKQGARQEMLRAWKNVPATLVMFETAPRLEKSCRDILQVLGNRKMTVLRELTKKFEDIWPLSAAEILAKLEAEGEPKGEIVLVIGRDETPDEIDLDDLLKKALEKLSVKEAAALVAGQTGVPKKQVYARALELKDEN